MKDRMHPQGPLAFLPEIEHRIDSLYTALDTLLVSEQFEAAFHLSVSLYPYWETYENLSEGVGWLLKLMGPGVNDRFRPTSLPIIYAMLGNLLRHQSEYQLSTTYYRLGLACLKDQPDYRTHVSILGGLGEIAFRQGSYEAATGFYQSYLETGRQAGDERYVADALNALGRLANVKGDFSEALEYHQYGQHLCEQNDYQTGLAWMFNALGELERSRGKYGKAAEYFQESTAIFERLGNVGAHMLALQNLAFAHLRANGSRSEKYLQKTLNFWKRGPAKHGMALSMIGLCRVEIARGNIKQAADQLSVASQLLRQAGVQLELGDRADYEIALDAVQKKLGSAHYQLLFEQAGGRTATDLPGTNSGSSSVGTSAGRLKGTVLTERETAILKLVARGLTDKQIAGQLVISLHTVNAHLKSVYRKLAVNNRTSAVAVARFRRIV